MDIKAKIKDLIVQATKERSHYYVKSVCEEALKNINALENEVIMQDMLLDAAERVFDGGVVSDFEESFPVIRKAMDTRVALNSILERIDGVDAHKIADIRRIAHWALRTN
jgi:hypothetical protein